MAFERYQWTDRSVQYPGRRRILNVADNTDAHTVDVQRNSDTPSVTGDRFNASTMNNLESRLSSAFAAVQAAINAQFNAVYPVGSIYTSMENRSPQTIFNNGSVWVQITGDTPFMLGTSPGTISGNDSVTITPTGTVSLSGSVQEAKAELVPHTHNYNDRYSEKNTTGDSKPKGKTSAVIDSGFHKRASATAKNTNDTTGYAGGLSTSQAGDCKAHSHPFGPVYGTFTGKSVTIDLRQPQQTVYAWRRTQ